MPASEKYQNLSKESLIHRVEWEPRKVSASLVIVGEEYNVWIAANEDLFQEADFLLPIVLLPAMRAGATLKLAGRVSPRLLSSIQQIQDIFNMWESIYKHIPVTVEARGTMAERGSGVACFFGGGVDSFHTTLKHYEEISHLIFLHRRPSEDPSVVETNIRRARKVAEGLGKSLVEVETNLHAFSDQTLVPWKFYHGMWIASAALLFQHLFGKVLISGSSTSNYDSISPQGTHPLLDPLWSTELTDFRHIGCEAWRVEKAAYIADYPVAMKYLQVCPSLRNGYNCGECEKCLRTMINFKIAGALERCETLPKEIDPQAVAEMDLSGYYPSLGARENLRALEELGTEPELSRALKEAIDKGRQMILRSGYSEKRLNWMHSQLKACRRKGRALKERNERLIQRNSWLEARCSSRRYRLVDSIVESIYRIPGLGWLLSR